MTEPLSRRHLLTLPIVASAGAGLSRSTAAVAAADDTGVPYGFPSQDVGRVRDTVRYAHVDIDRVRELVSASPALANAAVDWGFGDWETAIGAASHMGRRDMAALLLEHGARPDIFTHAMLGHLDVVRAVVGASPGIAALPGPHGISLLSHAQAGGPESQPVVSFLESLPGAAAAPPPEFDPPVYVGDYAWGAADDQRLTISERDGMLRFGYGDGFPRNLFAVGGDAFHPVGAPAVRIRFEVVEGSAHSVSVHDPDVILTARRVLP